MANGAAAKMREEEREKEREEKERGPPVCWWASHADSTRLSRVMSAGVTH
jgi:hypothetical protein